MSYAQTSNRKRHNKAIKNRTQSMSMDLPTVSIDNALEKLKVVVEDLGECYTDECISQFKLRFLQSGVSMRSSIILMVPKTARPTRQVSPTIRP